MGAKQQEAFDQQLAASVAPTRQSQAEAAPEWTEWILSAISFITGGCEYTF